MRPICWLHISDIHMRARDAWSQDVVLTATCDHIARQRTEGNVADFILVTGDIAFSGKADEYMLAVGFFDALCIAAGMSKERIFCVPGNHDIDRDRQSLCFTGGRASLQNLNRVDELLAAGEDLSTLLMRQENYRHFQKMYFGAQDLRWTANGLAYVSHLTIEDVRLAIVGLDSAWLAEGGISDHGKLLIGERQVIDALDLAQKSDDSPHVILGMAHHPVHLLQEFDRVPVQNRIERACHFFHCGHLHEPEARAAGFSGTGCLTLAAGASFETRQSHNTYSVVTLDLLRSVRRVNTVQYNPSTGMFSPASSQDYRVEVTPAYTCSVGELAHAIKVHRPELAPWVHYMSALLLDQKAELPIPTQNGHTFGSFAVLQAQPDSELKRKTADFMTFRNALRVLYKRVALADIFVQHGVVVVEYGSALEVVCNAQPSLKTRLAEYEKDAQMLASTEPIESFTHTGALLAELAAAQEWVLLREHAQRHVDTTDTAIAMDAKRMLALSLAHSSEAADKESAVELYRALVRDDPSEISDTSNLATLLIEAGHMDEAKATVLDGIKRSPANRRDYIQQIGQRIVEATGDRNFRRQMEIAEGEGGKRG